MGFLSSVTICVNGDKDSCDLTSESCVSVVALSERVDHSENISSSSLVHLDALARSDRASSLETVRETAVPSYGLHGMLGYYKGMVLNGDYRREPTLNDAVT